MRSDPGDPSPTDLAILLDTTGTMGLYVAALRRHLPAALRRLEGDVRLAVVAFKDHGAEGEDETYLTRVLPFGPAARVEEWLAAPALAPGKGGGGAEAVECALRAARGLAWRDGARRRVVLIGDKPPHGAGLDRLSACPCRVDYRDEVEALARRGTSVSALQVGQHLATGRVFEWLAARTGGAFARVDRLRDLPAALAAACLPEALAMA